MVGDAHIHDFREGLQGQLTALGVGPLTLSSSLRATVPLAWMAFPFEVIVLLHARPDLCLLDERQSAL